MNSPVNFAIVGFGHIGKRHADILTHHPKARLLAICDIHPVEAPIGVINYPSLGNLIDEKLPIDVIVIATPNGLHCEQALQALGAGYDVIIEKPIALSTISSSKILEKAALLKRSVFVVNQNRYSNAIIELKELIESGNMGKVCMLQMNCFWNRGAGYYKKDGWQGTMELDGGTLFTQFSHFLDILLWIFGEVSNISARSFNFSHQKFTEFDDSGVIIFDLLKGGIGSLNYTISAFQENYESSILVIGEKGTIKIGGAYMDKILFSNIPSVEIDIAEPIVINKNLNHERFYNDTIEKLLNHECSDSAKNGYDVVKLITRIDEAMKKDLINSIKKQTKISV